MFAFSTLTEVCLWKFYGKIICWWLHHVILLVVLFVCFSPEGNRMFRFGGAPPRNTFQMGTFSMIVVFKIGLMHLLEQRVERSRAPKRNESGKWKKTSWWSPEKFTITLDWRSYLWIFSLNLWTVALQTSNFKFPVLLHCLIAAQFYFDEWMSNEKWPYKSFSTERRSNYVVRRNLVLNRAFPLPSFALLPLKWCFKGRRFFIWSTPLCVPRILRSLAF